MRLRWPLTGRSEEIQTIEAAISDPDSAGIVISGAAGVGKSRIAREALTSAASKGWEVRWAVATTSARELPLGALASWAGPAGSDSLQLVRDVIGSLTAAAPGTRVVVGIDDAHLLDDLSTFVVHQVVQRGAAKLLVTVRDGEPIPTGLQEVWTRAQFDRLDLQPLSQDEITTLVSATLGGRLDPDAAHRLWKLTRGNALYLCNIVEQEVSDGRLARQHDYWRGIGDPIVPASLAELVESRIGNLPAPVADVIDALAVGEPIELESLVAITDPAAVEEADVRGLITLDHTGSGVEVRVAHPLYGEVRRKRAAPTRLRRLRGLVAAELAKQGNSDDMRMVVRRAALSINSDRKPEQELLVRAAQGAAWLADLALADRLSEAAIGAGAGAEASITRARVLTWLGRGQAADTVLAAIDTTNFSAAERARLAFLRASNMLWALSDPTGAKTLIDDASRTVPTGSRNCLDAFLSIYWAAMGKPEQARQSSAGLIVEQLPGIVGAEAAWAITLACGDAGSTSDALAAADAGYAVTSRHFEAAQMGFTVADAHLSALLLSGRVEEARTTAERLCEQADDLPGGAQLLGRGLAGRAALAGGRLDTACSLLDPVIEVLFSAETSGGFYGFGYRYQHPRTIALAMLGLTRNAAAALAALDEQDFPSWRYLGYERGLAHAWVAASQGAVSEAIKILLSAAKTAKASQRFAAEVMCLQTACQFGDGSSVTRLRELGAIVEGPRVGVAARFAAALRAGDGAELAAVSEEFERMGDLVAAVDAAAHAAVAYRRKELRGSAFGCSTRADALADQCGGARTPVLRQASERLPLTDREREIAMLLADGLSGREVADRLTLSLRTVEGHIYHAMTKSGVSSREELAALLPGHGPKPQ
jgi:DNA-binding CsgD family transcriptional regulator